jgi:hypothetical protein
MAHDIFFGTSSRDWSCGSMLLPAGQQRALLNKVDDVRYDIRQSSKLIQIGMLSLSAAIGFVAVSNLWRLSSNHPPR